MLILCTSVVMIYLFVACYKSSTWMVAYHRVLKHKKKQQAIKVDEEALPYLFICIPGLREQSIVKETIEYFEKFRYPKERLSILIITTEKETEQKRQRKCEIPEMVKKIIQNPEDTSFYNNGIFSRNNIPTVLELIQKHKDHLKEACDVVTEYYNNCETSGELVDQVLATGKFTKDIVHIHYPEVVGGKPEQLNYALNYIEQRIKDGEVKREQCFIGVYDFDGRPDLRTGSELQQVFAQRIKKQKQFPSMIQQIQLPYSNLKSFQGNGLQGVLLRGNAVLYLRRALGIELYKFQKCAYIFNQCKGSKINILRRPVTYGIGSGMYVSYSALKRIDNFPTPMEDLATGYRMQLLGEEMMPLEAFNMMEAYDSYKQMTNSGSISFRGAFRIIKDYQKMIIMDKHHRLSKCEKMILVMKEWIESSIWMIGNLMLLIAYIYLIYRWKFSIQLLLLALPLVIRFYYDSFCLNTVMERICTDYQGITIEAIKSSFGMKLFTAFISPVQGLARMISPLKALKFLFCKYVLKIKVEQKKTER